VLVIQHHPGKGTERRGPKKRKILTRVPVPASPTFSLGLAPFRMREMKTVTPG
jgi:hypothetical protein